MRRRAIPGAVALGVACVTGGCARRTDETPRQAPAVATRAPDIRVRPGCPFEGCIYGTWTPLQPVPVYTTEGDTAQVVFTLGANHPVAAVRGNVHVRPGLAVSSDTLLAFAPGAAAGTSIAPGDTVVVLDYVGEGTYNAEIRGEPYQVEQFWATARGSALTGKPRGTLVREPQTRWWVLFRDDSDREGWGLIRRSHRFKGWDRHSGPE